MFHRWWRRAKIVSGVVFGIGALLVIIPLLQLALFIVDLPRRIGEYLNFEGAIRWLLYKVLDPEEMRAFRDDMMLVLFSEAEIEEGLDRWSLLYEMDNAQHELERRLQNGELAFSIAGGLGALLIGNFFGYVLGGIALTLIAIGFSVLVAARIIITQELTYKSVHHRNAPLREIALRKGWNTGPIFGTGAIAVAILSAVVSREGDAYAYAQDFLSMIAKFLYRDEDKWKVQDSK